MEFRAYIGTFIRLAFLLLICEPAVWAQRSRFQQQKIAITAGIGISNYSGDLSEFTPRYIRPAVSVGASYQLLTHLAARADLRIFQLEGSQANTPNFSNNLSFRSINPDLWGGLEASLLPVNSNESFNISLYGGIGATYLSPGARYQGRRVSLPPLQTENVSYSRLAGVVPVGLTVTYRINSHYAVQGDLSYTYALTDYVDDVSTVYPDPDDLKSALARALSDRRPELGLSPNQPGFVRGNPRLNDTYILLQIRVKRYLSVASRQYRRSLRCYR